MSHKGLLFNIMSMTVHVKKSKNYIGLPPKKTVMDPPVQILTESLAFLTKFVLKEASIAQFCDRTPWLSTNVMASLHPSLKLPRASGEAMGPKRTYRRRNKDMITHEIV